MAYFVRTFRGVGNIHELTTQLNRYKSDILGYAEITWKNPSEFITDESHKIVYSGQQ